MTKNTKVNKVDETETKEETVTKEKETTKSGNYLKMWKEVAKDVFRPQKHQFEVVDGKFDIEIEKNNKMDTTKVNITYQGKKGPMKFSIGSYTKTLGKVWVGAPEEVNAQQEAEVH